MSVSSCPLDASDKFLLRWSEDAFSPLREAPVQILEACGSEAVIRSALSVLEKTEVYLIGKYSTETGIVRSCLASGGKFIVTIVIDQQGGPSSRGPEIDPGVLMVDGFLTEEQELRILDELDEEIQRQQFCSLAGARAYVNSFLGSGARGEGTAVLNRLFKFTARSSTALVSNGVVQFWSRFRQAAGTCNLVFPHASRTIANAGTVIPPKCGPPVPGSLQ